ncbi:protein of unknown function [Tepidibacter aestuarii]|nr:protein of unknown function [Tepidibacter aestuarii]
MYTVVDKQDNEIINKYIHIIHRKVVDTCGLNLNQKIQKD